MGWTKHPDAVQAHRDARLEAYTAVKQLAKALRSGASDPDVAFLAELDGMVHDLHRELQNFSKMRRAVGGQEDVDLAPYVHLVLSFTTSITWRTYGL